MSGPVLPVQDHDADPIAARDETERENIDRATFERMEELHVNEVENSKKAFLPCLSTCSVTSVCLF